MIPERHYTPPRMTLPGERRPRESVREGFGGGWRILTLMPMPPRRSTGLLWLLAGCAFTIMLGLILAAVSAAVSP